MCSNYTGWMDPAYANTGDRADGATGAVGTLPLRSVGNREGRRAPTDRGGRPDSGRDEAAVYGLDELNLGVC